MRKSFLGHFGIWPLWGGHNPATLKFRYGGSSGAGREYDHFIVHQPRMYGISLGTRGFFLGVVTLGPGDDVKEPTP